jgi:hypothetical protein
VVCQRPKETSAGLSNSATGQALGAVGYNWTKLISTTLGYRVLYSYDKEDASGNRSFRHQQWRYGPVRRDQVWLLRRHARTHRIMTDKLAELGAGLLVDHKKDVTLAIGPGGLLRVLQTERDAPCHSDQP